MAARTSLISLTLLFSTCLLNSHAAAAEVVAFWGFSGNEDFVDNPNKQDYMPEVDNTVDGGANLQAYLGVADELDNNGGGGFVSYTSPTSGITYGPTRTLKFDDLKGGGDDFDIDGVTTFTIDKNDGLGPVGGEDFANDALLYITLNGLGFKNFALRFDIEGTPGDLPSTFDVFYRVDGPGGTWYREADQNNIPLNFMEYTPADPENQYADSGMISLSSLPDDWPTIEIIVNDFSENGNGEMEIDNLEIIANRIPEPATAVLLLMGSLGAICSRFRPAGPGA